MPTGWSEVNVAKKKYDSSLEDLYQSIRDSSFLRDSERVCRFCGTPLKSYKSHFCSTACSQAFKEKLEQARHSLFKKPKLSRLWDSDPKKYDYKMPFTCEKCGMTFPEESMVKECEELDMNVKMIDQIMGRRRSDPDDA